MEKLSPETILNDRYKIVNLIKKGGMGAIYKATDKDGANILYAVKELLFSGTPEEYNKSIEQFQREAEILANLDYYNLPKVIDYFVSNEKYYLVMDFIVGEDLESKLKKEGTPGLLENEVIKWSKEILKILNHLHNQNPSIIHRDIKPSNIMIHEDERIMLVDFGLARFYEDDKTKTMRGTPSYCPIEQYQGKAEPKSDIYALGATMYHLLKGDINGSLFDFEPIPNISSKLNDIIKKAMSLDIKNRYSNAEEMFENLENIYTTKMLQSESSSIKFNENQKNDLLNSQEDRLSNINVDTIDDEDDDGYTLLHKAVLRRNIEFIKILIEKDANINAQDRLMNTPLHIASSLGLKEMAEFLISKGADINANNDNNSTPLEIASSLGYKDIVELLISEGADIDVNKHIGLTPLRSAILRGHKEIVELLISKGADIILLKNETLLHDVCRENHKEMAEFLISKGADINAQDRSGNTPLLIAVLCGHKEIVELLISKGADVNIKNINGYDPLLCAIKYNYKKIIKLLYSIGAQ